MVQKEQEHEGRSFEKTSMVIFAGFVTRIGGGRHYEKRDFEKTWRISKPSATLRFFAA